MDFVCWLFWMKMVKFDSKFHSKWNLLLFSLVAWQTDRNRKEKVRTSRSRKPNFKAIIIRTKTKTKEVSNFEDKKDAAALHSIEMWLDFRPTFSSRVSLLFKPFFSSRWTIYIKQQKKNIFNFPQSFYPWFRKITFYFLNVDCKRIVNKTKQINHCAKKEVFIAKVCQAYLSIAQQFFQFKSFAFAGYHPL